MMPKDSVKEICGEIVRRIDGGQVRCFKGMDKPLFLISRQYPGVWLEHAYDSVMLAKLFPKYLPVAENTVEVFLGLQTPQGQLPFCVIDRDEHPVGYSQIQECVSFFSLCLDVYGMTGSRALLEKAYEGGKKWIGWLKKYRMTLGKGLIEMFCGYDTGHDNSARLDGISCRGNYSIGGVRQNASVLPPDDGVTPILAVDMNANYYGDLTALSRAARILGDSAGAAGLEAEAAEVKKKLFEYCFDEKDAFFYDADRSGAKRKYKSSTIFHLFLEKVLDPTEDGELTDRIYAEHIKNPREFWTPYPFPSMAADDPSVENHAQRNCWGYYSQALIVLRCTRWMDFYGHSRDFDHVLERWISAWTEHYGEMKLGQELDPLTGVPTQCSEWYSSCMLDYIYGARRLGLIREGDL